LRRFPLHSADAPNSSASKVHHVLLPEASSSGNIASTRRKVSSGNLPHE